MIYCMRFESASFCQGQQRSSILFGWSGRRATWPCVPVQTRVRSIGLLFVRVCAVYSMLYLQ